jgi:glucose-6-phosphate isomerase
MPLTQSIDLALASGIGSGGLPDTALEAGLSAVGGALRRLREEEGSGRLPLLQVPGSAEDLEPIRATADRLRKGASDIVFLGTGGSSLGGQTLAQLAGFSVPVVAHHLSPRVHFLDNLDPRSMASALDLLPLESTRFVAISKSGGTGETLMQAIAALSALELAGFTAPLGDRFVGLSEPRKPGGRNALRDLLEPEGVPFLEHHTGIGGRYSGLTNVGLLPAAVLGLDLAAIRAGAAAALEPATADGDPRQIPAALGAALHVAHAMEGGAIAVLMAYADRFERLTRWWVQLWAESLGKEGRGTQPVAAIGPVDQHSQLQLYLGGPRDKLFTVLTTGVANLGPTIDIGFAERAGEADFGGRRIGDLVAAQGRATADTLARNGRPTRRLHLDPLDERGFGELLMHLMLETILTGYALGIDPFDQPAVEEGKVLAKRYLAESAR